MMFSRPVWFEGFCEMLWVAFAVMTGAAVLGALWPLSRRGAAADGEAQAIAFHKAQLAEIDRDVARGQLPPGEAAGARAEAARRLIAASDAAAAPAVGAGGAISRRRIAAVVVIALIPAIALGALWAPRQPRAARRAASGPRRRSGAGRRSPRRGRQGRGASARRSPRRARLPGHRAGLYADGALRRGGQGL